MRRILTLLIALTFVMSLGGMVAADTEEQKSKSAEEYKQKREMAEKLKKDGTLDEIDKKRQEYYKKYKDQLIDQSKITNEAEAKKAMQQLEQSITAEATASRGTNNISFGSFWDGDIILVHDGICPWGYYRHGGTYDADSEEFYSAQASDQGYGSGVIKEPQSWYTNNYDEAIGLYVPSVSGNCSSMLDYFQDQLEEGDSYNLTAFSDRDSWYCTKLPWVGYWDYFNINIHEWNFTMFACYPDNIRDDDDPIVFATGS